MCITNWTIWHSSILLLSVSFFLFSLFFFSFFNHFPHSRSLSPFLSISGSLFLCFLSPSHALFLCMPLSFSFSFSSRFLFFLSLLLFSDVYYYPYVFLIQYYFICKDKIIRLEVKEQFCLKTSKLLLCKQACEFIEFWRDTIDFQMFVVKKIIFDTLNCHICVGKLSKWNLSVRKVFGILK